MCELYEIVIFIVMRKEQFLPKEIEEFLNRGVFIFAKTMPEIPHFYVVKDNLNDNDKKLFDEFAIYITKYGYTKMFYGKEYNYLEEDKYKYWIIENILNREVINV